MFSSQFKCEQNGKINIYKKIVMKKPEETQTCST